MKKILIPTDFSDNASNALSYAFQLFKGADMIALIPHTYTFFGKLLHKSVSKQIAFESKTPILVGRVHNLTN